ncbi:MAG: triose-phosphate isomerase [Proteobacteria bacterium]|nr:triose-phosphate isomerase [Pseudomonadota bacterium]
MARRLTVVGNWKMHGSNAHLMEYTSVLAAQAKNKFFSLLDVVICPPFPYLEKTASVLADVQGASLGAQDVSAHQPGAFTGQVSASMLVDIGCRYVIVGHSERRQFNQESDLEIAGKFLAAQSAGLIPILCIGETKEQRLANLTDSVVINQLQPLLGHGIGVFEKAIIAYEPIWAIGTGLTATPEQAQAIHHLLRRTLAEYDAGLADSLPILYGGSVKQNNAGALFAMPDIDGALVGGASLNAQEFLAICAAA